MLSYSLKRLLLMLPTLLGIITINFFLVQTSPGGPVERMINTLTSEQESSLERISGTQNTELLVSENTESANQVYQGSKGLDEELINEIKQLYGFDKPLHERFLQILTNYLSFEFGESFFKDKAVVDLVLEKLPVSISLGLWSTLLVYMLSIPLGIQKAIKHGSRFDVSTSTLIIIGNAVPVFLLAILFIILFAGGEYWQLFPLRGLFSEGYEELSFFEQVKDYFWHLTLPLVSMLIGSFASMTMLTKNSFLDEISKQYVLTAMAKGASNTRILYKHVFRNAMLIIISGFPAAFIGIFFTGSLLIEVIFSLDGLGLLGFEATMNRDYPVMFGTLYIFTIIGLLTSLVSDLCYMLIDPRISFEKKGA